MATSRQERSSCLACHVSVGGMQLEYTMFVQALQQFAELLHDPAGSICAKSKTK